MATTEVAPPGGLVLADPITRAVTDPITERISAWCPDPVRRCSMLHEWNDLTFLHWAYDPEVVQALLPPGLKVHTYDDKAWVGLVPFMMRVETPNRWGVPWVSNFCETNVRTYARAADGTTGVWFLSLDAARFGAVAVARAGYHLPYYWSRMRLSSFGNIVTYESRRRWPGPRGAASKAVIEVGDPYAPGELGDRDHWLTARWRLFSHQPRGLRSARADHAPWVLHRASVLHLDDELVQAAGLPAPSGDPLVHWSPGVAVRIGWPHALGGRRSAR